jgi:hypothetical protein
VNQHAVEHHSFRLVFVEAEVEELAQKTPTLRRAEGVSVLDGITRRLFSTLFTMPPISAPSTSPSPVNEAGISTDAP